MAPTAEAPPDLGPLSRFSQQLRPYQQLALGDALAFVREVSEHDEWTGAQRRRLYAAPTGSGKGTLELALLRELRAAGLDAWIVTPSLEIIRGFLERCHLDGSGLGDDALAALGETIYVSTPTRLRNRCLDGRLGVPDVWIVDEVHHAVEQNEVSGCNFALGPASAWVGYSATPYRGSPTGTAALREAWGEPTLLLTYPEAIEAGCVTMPKVEVVPLVDDDTIKIVAGEFQDKGAGAAYVDRLDALARLVASYHLGPAAGVFDVPTCVSVPTTECVGALVEALDRLEVEAVPVTQATKGADRVRYYGLCRDRRAVLVQIKVVSEGVDMPWLARMIDARPLVSPVAWLQQFGRITRPGHGPKYYVCTNRNLERHAYLLQGALPRAAVAAAQTAFLTPSKRLAARVVGLEAMGRLKPIELPLDGGVRTSCYMLWSARPVTDPRVSAVDEWAVLLDPCHDEPIVARRLNSSVEGEERVWGRWERAELPADFAGFASSSRRGALTDKQRTFWKRCARRYGLAPEAADDPKFSMRQFQALPVLKDLGLTLHARPVTGGDE